MSKSTDLLYQAHLGAQAAVDSAAGVLGDLRGDPDLASVCERDLELWQAVRERIYIGRQQALLDAASFVSSMDTACRDHLDAAPLGGPREALAEVLGVTLLVKTDAQIVAEFHAAVRGLMQMGY